MKKFYFIALITAVMIFSISNLHAQVLTVFDVNSTGFPTISAKFFAYNSDYERITNLTPADFEVTENGEERSVTLVTCPSQNPDPLSSVLTIDISGSMGWGADPNINLAKGAASAWVKALDLGNSECAISTFNHDNYFTQDFTTNETRLLDRIDDLDPFGGTDYDEALLNSPAGGIQVAKRGQHKRIIVFLTDGMPNYPPNTTGIINAANNDNITIYSITLKMPCPSMLQQISTQTGGKWFGNVETVQEAIAIYMQILNEEQGIDPCEIRWTSSPGCTTGKTAQIEIPDLSLSTTVRYNVPAATSIAHFEIDEENTRLGIVQPGTNKDTTVTLTAKNADLTINSITGNNANFSIQGVSFPRTVLKNQSLNLTVRYSPADSTFQTVKFDIDQNICDDESFQLSAGDPAKPPSNNTLKLTHPNGGEKFLICTDTIITWEGTLETDTVSLIWSTDNGSNWYLIEANASENRYEWEDLPIINSGQCLAKVIFSKYTGTNADWIKSALSINTETKNRAYSISRDASGNFYVAGRLDGTEYYDTNMTVSLISSGGTDAFVAKYNSSGEAQWARKGGGPGNDMALESDVDEFGSVFVTGYFRDTAVFDTETLITKAFARMFVAKYNTNGTLQWITPGGSSDSAETSFGMEVRTDNAGNIFVAGSFTGTADFGSSVQLTSSGSDDIFLAKYNSSGVCQWAKKAGGSGSDAAMGLDLDSDGNIFISGGFEGTSNFGNGKSLTSSGNTDAFVAKYNSSGECQWAKKAGGSGLDYSTKAALDDGGNLFAAGAFSGNADFGNSVNMNSNGGTDIFAAKYDGEGECQWARGGGSSNNEEALCLTTDYIGNVFVGGYFTGQAQLCSFNLAHAGEQDAFMLKYSNFGNCEWAYYFQSADRENCHDVVKDNQGNIFAAGASYDDFHIFHIDYGQVLMEDESDAVWSILAPDLEIKDLSMGQAVIQGRKDTLVTACITNNTDIPVKIDSLSITGSNASDFAVTSGIPPYELASGESKNIEFVFKPQTAGTKTAKLNIFAGCVFMEADLSGEAVEPKLEALTEDIDFKKVLVGTDKDTIETTIENTGSTAVTVNTTELIGPDTQQFSIIEGGGSFTLNPGESREVKLRFSPEETGRTSCIMHYNFNGPGSPLQTVLYGEGIVVPEITGDQSITYQETPCDSTTKTDSIEVMNTGNDTLKITAYSIEPAGSGFSLSEPNMFPVNILPDSSLKIDIEFKSSNFGEQTAALKLTTNAANVDNGEFEVTLNGKWAFTDFVLSRDNITFPDMEEDEEGTDTLTIINTGSESHTWTAPVDLGEFEIVSIQPAITPAGGASIVKVKFKGGKPGDVFTKSHLFKDKCNHEKTLTLEANVVSGGDPEISTNSSVQTETGICENSVEFDVEVSNTGGKSLTISDAVISGADASYFSFKTPFGEVSIVPGSSRKITLVFTSDEAGEKTALLTLTSNAVNANNGKTEITLTGKNDILKLTYQPNSIDFGELNEGETSDRQFTISNEGSVSVDFSYAIPFTIGRFMFNELNPAEIQPGETSTGNIKFLGGSAGQTYEQTFMLQDTCKNTYTFSLKAQVRDVESVNETRRSGVVLCQNVPNPSSDLTSIEFELNKTQSIELSLHDVLGRKIAVAAEGIYSAGRHLSELSTAGLSPGTYFYILTCGNVVLTRKLEVIK